MNVGKFSMISTMSKDSGRSNVSKVSEVWKASSKAVCPYQFDDVTRYGTYIKEESTCVHTRCEVTLQANPGMIPV
jgi:hypothetical protein